MAVEMFVEYNFSELARTDKDHPRLLYCAAIMCTHLSKAL